MHTRYEMSRFVKENDIKFFTWHLRVHASLHTSQRNISGNIRLPHRLWTIFGTRSICETEDKSKWACRKYLDWVDQIGRRGDSQSLVQFCSTW
ncbi:hypothetical protein KIN20_005451 [Parelaphostrongylus tenuis]|uniref:Uncharacterized protein n=1 Tax=Parelaphostrongylus tenuis TaxID=148309 RepID=A0AAD5QG18_PARTN|nr:hypothetical protein KIN20_005451 [Parelaphostrongylus tenuis]